MKKIAISALLLLAAVSVWAARPADYHGKWLLDRAASRNLPRRFERVQTHRLVVEQTNTKLSIGVHLESDGVPPMDRTMVTSLDGKPTLSETVVRTPMGEQKVPLSLHATVRDDGRLDVVEERQLKTPDGERTLISTELWQLSSDGKTLTVHRNDEMPNGKVDYDMVFKRDS
jgi:hypothetical protein